MPLHDIGQAPNVPETYPGERSAPFPAGSAPTAIGKYANMSADSADALLSIAAAVHSLAHATHKLAAGGAGSNDEQVGFEIDASLMTAGGFQCHLPSGCDINGYSIENNSTSNTLTVYAGSSAAGRLLNTVPGGRFKTAAVPMGITSLCIVPANATNIGIVRIIITTRAMTIGQGPAV